MSNGKRKRRDVRRETKDGKSHWEESSTKQSKNIWQITSSHKSGLVMTIGNKKKAHPTMRSMRERSNENYFL